MITTQVQKTALAGRDKVGLFFGSRSSKGVGFFFTNTPSLLRLFSHEFFQKSARKLIVTQNQIHVKVFDTDKYL